MASRQTCSIQHCTVLYNTKAADMLAEEHKLVIWRAITGRAAQLAFSVWCLGSIWLLSVVWVVSHLVRNPQAPR